MGSDYTSLQAHILDGKEYRPPLTSPDAVHHRTNSRHVEGLTHTTGPERDGVERVPSFIGRMGQSSLGSI